MSRTWRDEQVSQLRPDPIFLDSCHWLYETATGLELYCENTDERSRCVGTVCVSSIKAYLRRWEKARK